MDITLRPGQRSGETAAPSSKSYAQRMLICAGLSVTESVIDCGDVSNDIAAGARCMNALSAEVTELSNGVFRVKSAIRTGEKLLRCGESGTTLRLLLPAVGALGETATFKMEGRLPQRPLAPLDGVLRAHGMVPEQEDDLLHCSGKLSAGHYEIPGNVSSQFISGLLIALPLLDGDSELVVTGKIESAAYIGMTESVLKKAGINYTKNENTYTIPGNQQYRFPPEAKVEGDCSNAAFFLSLGALSEKGIVLNNVPADTLQGDKAIVDILRRFGADITENGDTVTVKRGKLHGCTVDAAAIPDLVPVLSTVASVAEGETRIINAGRLRIKESDRLKTTTEMLNTLGADVEELPEGLIIRGRRNLVGGTVSACNDHRIAMSAAVAASVCTESVTVLGCECTNKSFPRFWELFDKLECEE